MRKSIWLAGLLTVTLAVAVQADDFTYTTNDDNTITITDYTGSGGAVAITNMIEGLPVTIIGDFAFYYCTSLTSVTIPNSVTSIGGWAFFGCSGLTNAAIGNSVTIIGSFAFYECSDLISVTIPTSVTNIGDGVFYGCSSLTNLIIGNGVNNIGDGAFSGCTSLTSIAIPASVTNIGYTTFSGCTSLTAITVDATNSIYSSLDGVVFDKSQAALILCPQGKIGTYTIPDSVTNIGDGAFSGCTSLTNLIIGNGVTSIRHDAFSSLTNLKSVTIGDGVTSIGDFAFYNCSSLTSVTIGKGVTSIGEGAFGDCTSLTNLIIGNGVTSIGGWAFRYCASLTIVTIPNSVTNIGYQAFYDCFSLTCVTIGNGVDGIGELAFADCISLSCVTIGSGVTHIGDYAFAGCINLTGVYFQGNAPPFCGIYMFAGANSVVIYRLSWATGWPPVYYPWADCPITALWDENHSDTDGLPDWWEQKYFGGFTNGNPDAICSNGINTVREAYIAGLNPNDPQSTLRTYVPSAGKVLGWNAVSGRVYSVYWTTNLLSGFQCLESNIPWTRSSFTNPATVPCGYYKIDVRLEK